MKRANASRVMARIRKALAVPVQQAWDVYRALRTTLAHPVSLTDVSRHREKLHGFVRKDLVLSEVSAPPAVVPEVRAPEPADPFALEAPPVEITPRKGTKVIHDVTARIEGPAKGVTPDTLRAVWWRVAMGHEVTTFTVRVVNWRKHRADGSVPEYPYSGRDALDAIANAKPLAVVQGGKRALRVARVDVDYDNDWAEYEITLYYDEQ